MYQSPPVLEAPLASTGNPRQGPPLHPPSHQESQKVSYPHGVPPHNGDGQPSAERLQGQGLGNGVYHPTPSSHPPSTSFKPPVNNWRPPLNGMVQENSIIPVQLQNFIPNGNPPHTTHPGPSDSESPHPLRAGNHPPLPNGPHHPAHRVGIRQVQNHYKAPSYSHPGGQASHVPEVSVDPVPVSASLLKATRQQKLNLDSADFHPDGESDTPISLLISQANICRQRNNPKAAVELYELVLRRDPDNTECLNWQGRCWKQLGQVEQALRCYDRALTVSRGQNWNAHNNRGAALQSSGQLEMACEAFRLALNCPGVDTKLVTQNLSRALTDLGIKMKNLGALDHAFIKFREAAEVDPNYHQAHFNLGVMLSFRNQFDQALVCYTRAVECNPNHVEALGNIGVIHKNQGRLEEAIRFYELSLKSNPNFQLSANNLAIAYTEYGTKVKQSGKMEDGIEYYRKALVHNPKHPDAWYNLGVALAERARYSEAITAYQMAVTFNPNCAEAFNNLGVIYKDRGNLMRAIQFYNEACRLNPSFAQTLNNLGVIYTQLGRLQKAMECCQQAVRVNPRYAEAYNNLGVLLRDEGAVLQAVLAYDMCLKMDPDNRMAGQNKLLAFNSLSLDEDEAHWDMELHTGNAAAAPSSPASSSEDEVGMDISTPTHRDGALASSNGAVSSGRAESDGLDKLLPNLKQLAQRHWTTLVAVSPASLPKIQSESDCSCEAVVAAASAMTISSLSPLSLPLPSDLRGKLCLCAVAPSSSGPLPPSGESQDRMQLSTPRAGSSLPPDDPLNSLPRRVSSSMEIAHPALGGPQLQSLGPMILRWSQLQMVDQLMAIPSPSPNAGTDLDLAAESSATSSTSSEVSSNEPCLDVEDSETMFRNRPLALAVADYIYAEHKLWGERFSQSIASKFPDQSSGLPPSNSPTELPQSENGHATPAAAARHTNPLTTRRPLRIGYLSADFFVHSVSYFIDAPIRLASTVSPIRPAASSPTSGPEDSNSRDAVSPRIQKLPKLSRSNSLDRQQDEELDSDQDYGVEVFCYANVGRPDARTQRFRDLAHGWRDVTGQDAREVAEIIRGDRIDILVELTGHTAGNRLDVMALSPAPVQGTWIGYPNTTGLPEIRYRFTDGVVDPVGTQQRFTEELIRLPGPFLCYSPPQDAPEPAQELPALRNGFVCFGSFNNLAKVNDTVLDLWCEILRRIPYSRMVMKCKPFACPRVRDKVAKAFQSRGISSNRIDLYGLIPTTRDHLRMYGQIDICLDTFPYAGTTTTCEALNMGVPVITLAPKNIPVHAHRVGKSLLCRVQGMEDFIAHSKQEYVQTALRYAKDLPALQEVRRTLRPRLMESELCNGPIFVAQLHRTYREIWKRHVLEESARRGLE